MNNKKDRQMIGIINNDSNGKQSIFLNRNSAIQYMLRPLILPSIKPNSFTGYISSFENNTEFKDDNSQPDDIRIKKFTDYVNKKLFIFSCHPHINNSDLEYPKMANVHLVPEPEQFNTGTYFYSVPVFAPANDNITNEWQEEHKWELYREYNTLEEFNKCIKEKKSVGRIYGYNAYEFNPSFIIWKDEEGNLSAIGKVTGIYYTTHGGLLIFHKDELCKIDICDYIKYIVYNVDINPALMFIPFPIYKIIEEAIFEKRNTNITFSEEYKTQSLKNDELIINLMERYSHQNNLFYNKKDLINVHTSVKCSSLTIFSGLNGSGKSQLAHIYAKALGIQSRFLFIPVKPSWDSDADLLGYVDLAHMLYIPSDNGFIDFLLVAQKKENKNKLFMVCFDEINLARVEYYFSQFISIMELPIEQRKLKLYNTQYKDKLYNSNEYPDTIQIGDNIRFIGTTSDGEPSYSLSDKILDRANVIHLDILNYAEQWIQEVDNKVENAIELTSEEYNNLLHERYDLDKKAIRNLLWELHQLINHVNPKCGITPRIVKSIETYICNLPQPFIDDFDIKMALDFQIAQRILTKVRGIENQIGDILQSDSENNFNKIFNKYKELSNFEKCRKEITHKQRELEIYGYCI